MSLYKKCNGTYDNNNNNFVYQAGLTEIIRVIIINPQNVNIEN